VGLGTQPVICTDAKHYVSCFIVALLVTVTVCRLEKSILTKYKSIKHSGDKVCNEKVPVICGKFDIKTFLI